jgi:hypothetical protein
MKISIALSVLILAVAAGFGWQNQQRLGVIRGNHAQLVAEAAQLGISLDPSNAADPVRITKRGRADREADAKLAATEFIAFSKEMEAIEKKGGPPDEAMQKRIMEMMDRMMSLDSAQLKILITELRVSKELKDETRQGLIGFSIMTLANEHPQAALALFTESSDLFNGDGMGTHVVSSSLSKWAKDDPLAALEWVKKNSEKFPDLVTEDTKRGLISGIAVSDPKLAFKLIGELAMKDATLPVSGIISAAKTAEDRTVVLGALREHLATITDEAARHNIANNAVVALARSVVKEGFEAGTKWLASANLNPAELESFASGLSSSDKNGESGRWIEWIGASLPADKGSDSIRNIVRNWTQDDFQAAGKWLTTAPEGPAKNTSIRSYAETVSRYEPETAAQWAMTLPPGDDRDKTLRQIYHNWPKGDDDAKEAATTFAKEHGIK